MELLKRADIVITNPPFSLFRPYVLQLLKNRKKFLIIGNVNAVHYKEIFKLIKENKVWLGESIHSGDREFRVPHHYPLEAAGVRIDPDGTDTSASKAYVGSQTLISKNRRGTRQFRSTKNTHQPNIQDTTTTTRLKLAKPRKYLATMTA